MRKLARRGSIVAVAAAALLTLLFAASANPSEIYMSDACSPSFNVALNDPTICFPAGSAARGQHPLTAAALTFE